MTAVAKQKRIVYLVGPIKSKIEGRKLPTARQVLQVFFYEHYENRHTIRESSTKALQQVMSKWNSGGFTVRELKHCIVKLEKLHSAWQKLKKGSKRKKSVTQREKEATFEKTLDSIFDIARNGLIDDLSESQKEFLTSQRSKNRRGFLPHDLPISSRVSESDSAETLMPEMNDEYADRTSLDESTVDLSEEPSLHEHADDTENPSNPNLSGQLAEGNEAECAEALSKLHSQYLLLVRSLQTNLSSVSPFSS